MSVAYSSDSSFPMEDDNVVTIKRRKGRPKGSLNKKKKIRFAIDPNNKSGIRPFQFKVLILPDATEKVTKGGIILVDDVQDQERRGQVLGTVIDVSPGAFSYYTWPEWVDLPKPGDRVYFARHSGSTIPGKDGVDYRMVNDQDIGAVIDF